MDAEIVFSLLKDLFANGLEKEGLTAKAANPFICEIESKHDYIDVNFKSSVTGTYTAKNIFFTPHITLRLLGIRFSKDGGIVKIANFPDIPFKYNNE